MPRNPHIEAILRDRYAGGRRKVPRILRQQEPRGLERTYLRDIIRLIKPAKELVDQLLIPRLPELDSEIIQVADAMNFDDYPEVIERIFGDIRLRYGQIVSEGSIKGAATGQAVQLDIFNRKQVARQFKQVLGVDVFAITPQLTTQIGAFTTDNVSLIESIPERYLRQVENTALRNLRAGNRFSEWKGDLPALYRKSRSSAALIARDQTNKFNGELNGARQTELGVDDYTWRTSEDERVREEHEAINGNVYSWTDPKRQPPEGHPGQPILCRCQGEPNIDAMLKRLGI